MVTRFGCGALLATGPRSVLEDWASGSRHERPQDRLYFCVIFLLVSHLFFIVLVSGARPNTVIP